MMKIREHFECKKVLDDYMVIPTGERMNDFSATIILSETAACAWDYLKDGCSREELVDQILKEYDISRDVVESDVDALLEKLEEFGVLEEV